MTLAAKTKETLCKSVNIAIVQIPEQMFTLWKSVWYLQ